MHSPLQDKGIVITRPPAQAGVLAKLLSEHGAQALVFPVIDIGPHPEPAPIRQAIAALASQDCVFFVSSNAVEHFFAHMDGQAWPKQLLAIGVGPSTAAALAAHGVARIATPTHHFDSEGVLALPALAESAIHGKNVLIVRGTGGRELVYEVLLQRGARASKLSCYTRCCAQPPVAPLLSAFEAGRLHALLITSSEGAHNFVDILGPQHAGRILHTLPCFAPHPRIVAALNMLGAQHSILSAPSDQGMLAALIHHFG